jgi:hypothetical protein
VSACASPIRAAMTTTGKVYEQNLNRHDLR